jgi:hypothetical protein
MIAPSFNQKHYRPALKRFLEPILSALFQRELTRLGPMLAGRLAAEVIRLFEALCPTPEHLRPGQLLWTVPDRNSSPRSRHRPLLPVILTLSCPEDAQRLAQGTTIRENLQEALSRMFREAHAQGGLLSVRDAALLLHHHQAHITDLRQTYEKKHQCILPHPGSLQDVGSTVSHKAQAIRKVVLERKDPATAAREMAHAQSSVDRYLRDYHRVKTLYDIRPDPMFIHRCTHIAKHVVRQYIELIEQEKKQNEQQPAKQD